MEDAAHYRMPQTFTKLSYHIVFATKIRTPWIRVHLENAVWDIIRHECIKAGGHVYAVGGVEDHVHIVVDIPPTLSISLFVKHIKGASSRLISLRFPEIANFRWQNGYSVFTCDKRSLPIIIRYVRNQRRRHGFRD